MIKCNAKKITTFHRLVSNKFSHKTVPHSWAHVMPLHQTVQNSRLHLSVHIAQYRLCQNSRLHLSVHVSQGQGNILLTVTRAGQRAVPCVKGPQPRDHCNMHNGPTADHCTSWYTSGGCSTNIIQLCIDVIMWTQVVTKQYPRIYLWMVTTDPPGRSLNAAIEINENCLSETGIVTWCEIWWFFSTTSKVHESIGPFFPVPYLIVCICWPRFFCISQLLDTKSCIYCLAYIFVFIHPLDYSLIACNTSSDHIYERPGTTANNLIITRRYAAK